LYASRLKSGVCHRPAAASPGGVQVRPISASASVRSGPSVQAEEDALSTKAGPTYCTFSALEQGSRQIRGPLPLAYYDVIARLESRSDLAYRHSPCNVNPHLAR
jgi:hypothetical protein